MKILSVQTNISLFSGHSPFTELTRTVLIKSPFFISGGFSIHGDVIAAMVEVRRTDCDSLGNRVKSRTGWQRIQAIGLVIVGCAQLVCVIAMVKPFSRPLARHMLYVFIYHTMTVHDW
ncbi:hypothetical protein PoB_002525100 [Plakobranchus ocellatus]|uniref:Uncharacterized protein n=1 Tax=Plakobranchus ocellatus TaxID=259542 RepID=A0AAV3ZRZ6_9GAST|nr:hypothetical protein PoB_002525100 [Plakobranchus ocellatus]